MSKKQESPIEIFDKGYDKILEKLWRKEITEETFDKLYKQLFNRFNDQEKQEILEHSKLIKSMLKVLKILKPFIKPYEKYNKGMRELQESLGYPTFESFMKVFYGAQKKASASLGLLDKTWTRERQEEIFREMKKQGLLKPFSELKELNTGLKYPLEYARIDKNLVEIPMASYYQLSKKRFITTYTKDNRKIEIGSMDGCWTGFDEKVFKAGVTGFMREIKGLDLVVSIFTYSDLRDKLKEKTLSTQRLKKSLKKICTTNIRYEHFIVNKETGKEEHFLNGAPLVSWYELYDSGEKGICKIVLNSIFNQNYLRYYHKLYINDYVKIKSPVERRVFEYLTFKLTGNARHSEHWGLLCKKVGIETSNKTRRLQILMRGLKILPKYGIEYAPKDYKKIKQAEVIRFKRTRKFIGYHKPIEDKETEIEMLKNDLEYAYLMFNENELCNEPFSTQINNFLACFSDYLEKAQYSNLSEDFLRELRLRLESYKTQRKLF